MKLQEIFNQLTYGELSQLALGGTPATGIDPANYSQVLASINLGLTALYKRFALKEGRLQVELVPGRLLYPLTRLYAVSNTRSNEPIKYIQDQGAPFTEDLLKIESVLTDAGQDFPLNVTNNIYSLHTPALNTLRVPLDISAQLGSLPEEYQTDGLTVVYRANHPYLDPDVVDPEYTEIELPVSHLTALLYFIASRVHNPIGLVNEFHSGNSYAAKFEAECQALEGKGLQVDQDTGEDRLRRNGWA